MDFGSLPQFGQQFGGFSDPSGFAGDMLSQGMFSQDPRKKKKQGGMFGAMSPMFGLAGMMPQALPFMLGGLGGGGLFSLLSHHGGD